MAKIGDIRHWKADTLEKLFDTASAKAASLHRLGEGMEQVAGDLSTWGGVTAGAWKDSAGKMRVDLGDKAEAAEKVAKAVKPAIDDVSEVTNKLGMLDQDAQAIGATITDDGKVVATRQVKDTDKHLQDDQISRLQQQVTTLEQRATAVEQEIAAALRTDVTDAPAPPVPQAPPVALNASDPVGGPDGNPPYPNGAKPTMIDGAKTIAMADNPPGYDQNTGPGPARDQNWKDYLSGKNADGTHDLNTRHLWHYPSRRRLATRHYALLEQPDVSKASPMPGAATSPRTDHRRAMERGAPWLTPTRTGTAPASIAAGWCATQSPRAQVWTHSSWSTATHEIRATCPGRTG
ncbi:polymorphic toxin protein [Mycobacterium phage prophi91-3]|nr:polymorphic toxin protein [Mycobacterium phage prophi91-3]